jgi:branched-subunit amino acid transport protein
MRSALTRAIFDKAMTAKETSSTVGEILSLISRDASILFQAAKAIQYLWSGPVEVAALTAVIAAYVGLSSLWVVGLHRQVV